MVTISFAGIVGPGERLVCSADQYLKIINIIIIFFLHFLHVSPFFRLMVFIAFYMFYMIDADGFFFSSFTTKIINRNMRPVK